MMGMKARLSGTSLIACPNNAAITTWATTNITAAKMNPSAYRTVGSYPPQAFGTSKRSAFQTHLSRSVLT